MTIGAVLAGLQEQFPDLTISKIRFLEAEGLLTPQRTASGYRLYADADLERLRYILTAQRDWFWPLKVIRDALDALDRGLTPAEDVPSARPVVPAPAPDADLPSVDFLSAGSTLRLTDRELREAAGLSADLLASLVTYGLVKPRPDGHYDQAALAVAQAAAALAGHGVEARHLRQFRTAAEREVGLVEQLLGPLAARDKRAGAQGGQDSAAMAAQILRQCLALHAALVKAELQRG